MLTSEWGNIFWYFIHWSAWFLKDWPMSDHQRAERMERLKVFYMILPYLLPCAKCGVHCKRFIKKDSPMLQNTPLGLAKWSYRLHNHTNKMLNRNQYRFDQVEKIYGKTRGLPKHHLLFQMVNIISEESLEKEEDSPYQIFFREFFLLLPYIFPCYVCSENLGLFQPYKEQKAELIWIEMGLPILRSHMPKKGNCYVFESTGWRSDGRAAFLKLYTRQKLRAEVKNLLGGYCKIYRQFPVIANRNYEIYIRGSSVNKHTVKILLAAGNTRVPLARCCKVTKVTQDIQEFPYREDIHLEFNAPDEEMVQLEIIFAPNSPPNDRFLLKELSVSSFAEISEY